MLNSDSAPIKERRATLPHAPETPPNEFMRLYSEESIDLSRYGIQWTPDGRIPYATFADGKKIAFISGNASSYAMTSILDRELIPRDIDSTGSALASYGPDKSEQYTNDGFKSDVAISSDTVKPLIQPPTQEATSQTPLPSIRYNNSKNRYEMVYESQHGFYATTSKDALHWQPAQQIIKFHQGQYPHRNDQVWLSNPTLWSDNTSDQFGDNYGYLIYSKGTWPQPHSMFRRRFTLK